MANTKFWQDAGMRPILELLRDEGPSLQRQTIQERLRELLQPTDDDALEEMSNGTER